MTIGIDEINELYVPETEIRNLKVVNGEVEARMLVGAGGHFCPVARKLGARADRSSLVVAAQEVEFEADPSELARGSVLGHRPELLFCEDLQGYGWCFRKGDYLNIGLGRVDKTDLPSHVAAFGEFLRERGKVACDIPERFHGHAYQLYERVRPKLIDERVLLIGDSAGLAYPQSGEGIRPAVESALMAAEVIAEAGGECGESALEGYRRRVIERFGEPRRGGAGDWLPEGWLRFIAAKLLATRWFSRHVVIDRWFLHAQQPATSLTITHCTVTRNVTHTGSHAAGVGLLRARLARIRLTGSSTLLRKSDLSQ